MSSEATRLRLLVVEDSDDDYEILLRELKRGGLDLVAERVMTAPGLAAALERPWDLMITDWMVPGFGGLAALEMAAVSHKDLPCIVISGTPNEDEAVAALRAGALDFISKDRPLRFVPAVERALREATGRRARIAVERELRLSEERYRSAFEIAPEALYTFDLESLHVVDANHAAVRLFGRSVTELRDVDLGTLSPETLPDGRRTRDVAREFIDHVRSGTKVAPFEWAYTHSNGEVIPVELHLVLLTSATGRLMRVTAIDLRERRKLEAIRLRTIELELQNRRIQEANRLKSEFLANMSHELRTPLNAIIGFAELLHDGQVDPGSDEHHEFLGDILTSGRHLLQLINDVLDLAKVEAGKLDFRAEPVDLELVIGEVVAITRTTAATKRIVVSVEIDASVTDIVLDPARFKQVAYNFLSNALKFTPEHGRVTIRVVPADVHTFRLEVEDTGVGIATPDLDRLFVEFQQLEAGINKRHQGTGLGLALVRRLVEAQGGTVGVRSTVGVGSTFHARLPRRARGGVVDARLAPPMTWTGKRTVLVVEDDARDRDLIVETLSAAGYDTDVAGTGKEAIARCREHAFDAVTLDLLLPDMSGLELLNSLRVACQMRSTPIIVVTIVPDVKVVAGFAVHDVLHKPLDREALLTALECAGVGPDRPGGVLVVDDDPSALRLMEATLAQLGYAAVTRTTGAAALEAAATLRPSAVILDLVMPGMDGITFLDQLRRLPTHARTPVLIWTIKELTASEHEQLRASAQAVISKNHKSPSTVVAQLRTLVGGER